MKKESYIAAAAFLAVVALIGAGCSSDSGQRPMVASSEPKETIELMEDISDESEEEVLEEEMEDVAKEKTAIAVPSTIGNRDLYVAEKIGFTTTVSIENTQSTDRTTVFSFDEVWEYDPSTGNTYERQEPAVDYSPARDQFAYIQDNEIYMYDVATDTTTALLTKTGESAGQIDGIEMPVWSVEGLPEGTMSIFALEYSPDGSKLRISSAFYEGLTHSVMDLENNTITHMSGGNYLHFQWSPDSSSALVAVPHGAMAAPGLFVATDGNFDETLNVYQHESAFSVGSAAWLEDNTIVMVYQDGSDRDDGLFNNSPHYLVHFNADGTKIADIDEFNRQPTIEYTEGMNVYLSHFSSEGQRQFAVVDATDYSADLLVGGEDYNLADVDAEKGMLVHESFFENDGVYTQGFVIFSLKGQHLYQTRNVSEGALNFH